MKTLIRSLALLAALTGIAAVASAQNNPPAQFADLKDPRISSKRDQKMIEVEAKGDPAVMGGPAFGLVFQLYYTAPETPKSSQPPFPKARWPEDLAVPRTEWKGLYALPVPDAVTSLPDYQPQAGLKASLASWAYGETAEILHLGPYNQEMPTIKRLKDYIAKKGYVTIGGHEEEYVVGPTQSGPGDPAKYVTIIRYRVGKAAQKQTS